jgi:hypothetical protein
MIPPSTWGDINTFLKVLCRVLGNKKVNNGFFKFLGGGGSADMQESEKSGTNGNFIYYL